jgi:hypothetical protein
MTINQLFTKKPSKELIEKLISSFGLSGFSDDKVFSKRDIDKNECIKKIKEFKDELSDCYLPCKRKIYLENIDYKRAITILRQCLRLYNYYIKSKEKYFNGDKLIIYQILPINNEPKKKENVEKTCIISFD